MSNPIFDHPIMSSPYVAPKRHWELDGYGRPTQTTIKMRCHLLQPNNPDTTLKTALKTEINENAWAKLHSNTSRPFGKFKSGRKAVKVINNLGDEVTKVFRVQ